MSLSPKGEGGGRWGVGVGAEFSHKKDGSALGNLEQFP